MSNTLKSKKAHRALQMAIESLEPRRLLAAVSGHTPLMGAQNVSLTNNLAVTFDVNMNAATLTGSTVELRSPDNVLLPTTLSYNSTSRTLTIDPVANLVSSSGYYFVRVVGGQNGVKAANGDALTSDYSFSFTTSVPNFAESTVFSGLTQPVAIEFSPDGRVFVAEKRGIIKVFPSLTSNTPTIFADLRTNVHNYWDRGLLGMALHPNFPTVPEVYVLYTYDADIGGTAPKWGTVNGDSDGGGSSPTGSGANVSGRLSRLVANGNVSTGGETVLIEDWANQFPSHSIGHLQFGPDGFLYASSGDGASFNFVDYGQVGNPFNDPVNEGGALRSLDVMTLSDPTGLDGTIIRINPTTGAAAPGNPLSTADANANRIIAAGLRNPFRFNFRPGTNEIWVGDVGWNEFEEINRVVNASGPANYTNFGWPAYEGPNMQGGYRAAGLPLLNTFYNNPQWHTAPYYAYRHSERVVSGSNEPTGGSSITGIAFYEQGNYPIAYNGAMFFADYSRKFLYVMYPGPDGLPQLSTRQVFRQLTNGAVELQIGPGGDLFYVDMNGGRVQRIAATGANRAPTARITASDTTGPAPLTINFSGLTSTDPDPGDTLSYEWDLDGDGQYNDSTAAAPSYTYTSAGTRLVRLRVTDRGGLTSLASLSISVGNGAPVPTISSPSLSLNWQVGQQINFSGSAIDPEEGAVPASRLRWDIVLVHGNEIDPTNTHEHPIQSFVGVASGSFLAIDHEWPSWIELRLTATDSTGLSTTIVRELQPQTSQITVNSSPAGGQVGLNGNVVTAPLVKTVIVGSNNSLTALSPQFINGLSYVFSSWNIGGGATQNIVAGATNVTYTATFVRLDPPAAPGSLVATAVSPSQINLAWTDLSNNETGFEVQRLDNQNNWVSIAVVGAGVTSFSHTNLASGTLYTYRVRSYNAAGATAGNTAVATTPTLAQTPYFGTPISIPGRIEAEYFDNGGQNVAWFDLNLPNLGGAFRNTEVDIEGTLDDGGGYNIGYLEAGEWMEYTINVPATGNYTFQARVASPLAGGVFHIEIDGQNVTGPMTVPGTGGWQDWTTIQRINVPLTAGTRVMRFVADSNMGFGSVGNVNWFNWLAEGAIVPPNAPTNLTATAVTNTQARLIWTDNANNESSFKIERRLGSGSWSQVASVGENVTTFIDSALTPGATYSWRLRAGNAAGDSAYSNVVTLTIPTVVQSPYYGSPIALPGTIQAEDFDFGGQGVSYNDLTTGNNGNEYRGGDVDIQGTGDAGGGFNIGWTDAGEWLEYTVSVATAGNYTLETRVANLGEGGIFHLELNGIDITGPIEVPQTGDWQTYTTITTPGIALPAGTHVLRLSLDSNGTFGSVGNFNWLRFTGNADPNVGDGLAVTYYNNANFTGDSVSRIDERVAFDWGVGSPDPIISRDTFSARWTGQVLAAFSETYTFHTRSDDGVRLWVNGQLLIDQWTNQAPTEWSGSITLVAGQKYDIRMDYFEDTGGAVAELRWSSPSTPKQIIPRANLFSTGGSTPQGGLMPLAFNGQPTSGPRAIGVFRGNPLFADTFIGPKRLVEDLL